MSLTLLYATLKRWKMSADLNTLKKLPCALLMNIIVLHQSKQSRKRDSFSMLERFLLHNF